MPTTYVVSAIPPEELDRIRARGVDDFGNDLQVRVADSDNGTPLRCCLRTASAGEEHLLIAYQPSKLGGPYAEVGPVFVHAQACDGWSGEGYPQANGHRSQLLRAYDARGDQVDNVIAEPGHSPAEIEALLARPDVAFLHSRNVLAGCFMFAVTRREPAGP